MSDELKAHLKERKTWLRGLYMLLFAIFMGRVEVTPEYHHLFLRSMNVAFIIFSFICLAGIFIQLAGKKTAP